MQQLARAAPCGRLSPSLAAELRKVLQRVLAVLIVLGLAGPAAAATEFGDIPFLQARIGQALETERTGSEVDWSNPETGSSGTIRILRTYFPELERPCRDYERMTRQADGAEIVVRGTGCRDAAGRWRLKEDEQAKATPEAGSAAAAPAATAPAASPPSNPSGSTDWSAPPPEAAAPAAPAPAEAAAATAAPPLPKSAPRSPEVSRQPAPQPAQPEFDIDMPTPAE